MVSDFSRIITLLRKEKGVTQKQAAEDLGVSQALLSHYEKGIRECGLEFVVRVADYYGVSCGYLLGRSEGRNGIHLPQEGPPATRKREPDGAQAEEVLPRKALEAFPRYGEGRRVVCLCHLKSPQIR